MIDLHKALSISQATQKIKSLLENTMCDVVLKGEISNLTNHSSGHKYFSLKDSGAQIAAIMFRGDTSSLKKPLISGDEVIVRGDVTVYPPRGNYQIVVREVMAAGLGAYLLKFEMLKKKLDDLGWFAPSSKKPLPPFPRTIGVITSSTGAAVHDIVDVATRRVPGIHIVIYPVLVQGDGAAADIANAIALMNRHKLADILIVGRGGGSIEDLWAFNEEIVARAIYESNIPIISAVGHETDYTIADFVADVRAPTPSAAAEIVTASLVRHIEKLSAAQKHIAQMAAHLLRNARHRFEGILRQPLLTTPQRIIEPHVQKLDEITLGIDMSVARRLESAAHTIKAKKQEIIALSPIVRISHVKQALASYTTRITGAWRHCSERRLAHINSISSTIKALNPNNILNKGYSIVFAEKSDSVILSTKEVSRGQKIRIRMRDGELNVITENVTHYD